MLTLPVLLFAYVLLAMLVWFSPQQQRLLDSPFGWMRRLLCSLFWWFYLLSRPSGLFLKTITFGFVCLATYTAITEAAKDKIYSLQPSDIQEVAGGYNYPADLTAEEMIRDEWANRKDPYISALNQNSLDSLSALVENPAEAAVAVMCYTLRNGVAVSDGSPSMKEIHEDRMPIDCYGASIITSSLLADDGFPPLLLSLRTSPKTFFFDITQSSIHMVYVYKIGDCLGYVGLQKTPHPIFNDLDELIADVSDSVGGGVVFTQYFLFNLNDVAPDYLVYNPGISGVEVWRDTDQAGWWDWLY